MDGSSDSTCSVEAGYDNQGKTDVMVNMQGLGIRYRIINQTILNYLLSDARTELLLNKRNGSGFFFFFLANDMCQELRLERQQKPDNPIPQPRTKPNLYCCPILARRKYSISASIILMNKSGYNMNLAVANLENGFWVNGYKLNCEPRTWLLKNGQSDAFSSAALSYYNSFQGLTTFIFDDDISSAFTISWQQQQMHVSQLSLAPTTSQNSSEEQTGKDKIEITQELTASLLMRKSPKTEDEGNLSKQESQREEATAASRSLITGIQATNE
ncbi:hypothetical protein C1645_742787 [Glomus cerebriforme]|uniref:Uncharacterized protein n=1 Tax=Glomus cerebriforme TaxID=658196 RepID=A0A397SI23_9GLOM|nr:hypothetical protein C1645_742787 [Glomus cerebriforme]